MRSRDLPLCRCHQYTVPKTGITGPHFFLHCCWGPKLRSSQIEPSPQPHAVVIPALLSFRIVGHFFSLSLLVSIVFTLIHLKVLSCLSLCILSSDPSVNAVMIAPCLLPISLCCQFLTLFHCGRTKHFAHFQSFKMCDLTCICSLRNAVRVCEGCV